ncbi:chromate efflux transporter [Microbacterium sp.]|uniref:chromate efflux transporter n=1 Tax=Microbacterium sp. TaxID=51671 RepID=UPI0025DD986A|nr:chromate efflux transporter [Microbacterium sp.]MBT9606192.1 chromate efflux transporter [Microbacterium sp.]
MTRAGTAAEVFIVFLRLGVTSFGGPIAHLGYFRDDLVTRRRWMDDRAYADLVALCQFLPGPASSQVGFAMGLQRAGFLGALAAFLGFTLPSAALLVAFAAGASLFEGRVGGGILDGLKIVAVAIVAQAVWGMARSLTPDAPRAGIAVVAAASALFIPGAYGQLGALVLGVVAGLVLLRGVAEPPGDALPSFGVSRVVAIGCLAVAALALIGLPALAAVTGSGAIALADAFFRSGALVFGGGHVVLPLLQAEVVQTGWVSPDAFLAGYGAAQAVPGPLFTFAAYLGDISSVGPGGLAGAAIALGAIFLPGFLVLVGVLPFWDALRGRPRVRAAMRGANAAVVGILGAALYTPVFTTAVTGPGPFVLALAGFVLLTAFRTPAWAVVIVGALGGIVLAFV